MEKLKVFLQESRKKMDIFRLKKKLKEIPDVVEENLNKVTEKEGKEDEKDEMRMMQK